MLKMLKGIIYVVCLSLVLLSNQVMAAPKEPDAELDERMGLLGGGEECEPGETGGSSGGLAFLADLLNPLLCPLVATLEGLPIVGELIIVLSPTLVNLLDGLIPGLLQCPHSGK